jgi:hypothetical protein
VHPGKERGRSAALIDQARPEKKFSERLISLATY